MMNKDSLTKTREYLLTQTSLELSSSIVVEAHITTHTIRSNCKTGKLSSPQCPPKYVRKRNIVDHIPLMSILCKPSIPQVPVTRFNRISIADKKQKRWNAFNKISSNSKNNVTESRQSPQISACLLLQKLADSLKIVIPDWFDKNKDSASDSMRIQIIPCEETTISDNSPQMSPKSMTVCGNTMDPTIGNTLKIPTITLVECASSQHSKKRMCRGTLKFAEKTKHGALRSKSISYTNK